MKAKHTAAPSRGWPPGAWNRASGCKECRLIYNSGYEAQDRYSGLEILVVS